MTLGKHYSTYTVRKIFRENYENYFQYTVSDISEKVLFDITSLSD